MTKSEKLRAYSAEPVLATLVLSLAVNYFSLGAVASFVHSIAKDVLSVLVVLFGAVLAIWIGLFWIAGTPFGVWLQQKGERDDIDATYVYSIWTFFIACIAACVGGVLRENHPWAQVSIAWVILLALLSVSGLISNTRNLLRLNARFMERSSKVAVLGNDTRPQDFSSGRK